MSDTHLELTQTHPLRFHLRSDLEPSSDGALLFWNPGCPNPIMNRYPRRDRAHTTVGFHDVGGLYRIYVRFDRAPLNKFHFVFPGVTTSSSTIYHRVKTTVFYRK